MDRSKTRVKSQRPLAEMSPAMRAYLQAIAAAGALVLAEAAVSIVHAPRPVAWLSLTAVAMLAGCFRVHFASVSANIAIDDTFFISTALLFGPGPGTLTIAMSCFLFSLQRRKPVRQIVFNTAALATSMALASRVFFALAGVRPLAIGGDSIVPLVAPLVAYVVVYFVLNSGFTAIAIGLDTRQSPSEVWRRNFRWLWIGYLGSASIAFCLVLLLQQHSLAASAMVASPASAGSPR